MTETRDFPVAVVASISTGIMLCKFSEMHEAAEFLMGHPIWTHHFASRQLADDMKQAIAAQCPGIPMKAPDWINEENYERYVAELEDQFGKTVKICKGDGLTAMLPEDGIPDHLKDKCIFIKTGQDPFDVE